MSPQSIPTPTIHSVLTVSYIVRTFDQWASERAQTLPLLSLKGAVVGVEASHFLDRFLSPSQEPLLSAVGGCPLGLRNLIESELAALAEADITPVFVFNGLDVATRLDPFAAAATAVRGNVDGFEVYQKNQAAQARRLFGASGMCCRPHTHSYLSADDNTRCNSTRESLQIPANDPEGP